MVERVPPQLQLRPKAPKPTSNPSSSLTWQPKGGKSKRKGGGKSKSKSDKGKTTMVTEFRQSDGTNRQLCINWQHGRCNRSDCKFLQLSNARWKCMWKIRDVLSAFGDSALTNVGSLGDEMSSPNVVSIDPDPVDNHVQPADFEAAVQVSPLITQEAQANVSQSPNIYMIHLQVILIHCPNPKPLTSRCMMANPSSLKIQSTQNFPSLIQLTSMIFQNLHHVTP